MSQNSKQSPKKPLKQQVTELKCELEKKHDKLLRLLAEFDNYRKRMEKDIFELSRKEKEQLLLRFLDIYDTLSMVCNTSKNEELLMMLNQFKRILNEEGIQEIDAVGKLFDHTLHHAVATKEGTAPDGTVIEEIKRGYLLNGRVFRPAYVIVTKGDKNDESDRY